MVQRAFADDVFTWPSDEPQLIGGRCTECGAVTFPMPPSSISIFGMASGHMTSLID